MHPLGHLSVSCGTVWVAAQAIDRVAGNSGARRILGAVDYRLVAMGALLPDLIDKPIGWIVLRAHFDGNGHLYGHTLLAAMVVVVPGLLLLVREHDPRILAMAAGMLMHFVVDPVNHVPQNLFWPLLGTEFDHALFLNWWQTIITETAAFIVFAWLALRLHRDGRLRELVAHGRLPALREEVAARG